MAAITLHKNERMGGLGRQWDEHWADIIAKIIEIGPGGDEMVACPSRGYRAELRSLQKSENRIAQK